MVKNIGRKCSVKDSVDKPLDKTPIGNKIPGLDPEIFFYELEDGNKTKDGE